MFRAAAGAGPASNSRRVVHYAVVRHAPRPRHTDRVPECVVAGLWETFAPSHLLQWLLVPNRPTHTWTRPAWWQPGARVDAKRLHASSWRRGFCSVYPPPRRASCLRRIEWRRVAAFVRLRALLPAPKEEGRSRSTRASSILRARLAAFSGASVGDVVGGLADVAGAPRDSSRRNRPAGDLKDRVAAALASGSIRRAARIVEDRGTSGPVKSDDA